MHPSRRPQQFVFPHPCFTSSGFAGMVFCVTFASKSSFLHQPHMCIYRAHRAKMHAPPRPIYRDRCLKAARRISDHLPAG
jgi:hypothetical protein